MTDTGRVIRGYSRCFDGIHEPDSIAACVYRDLDTFHESVRPFVSPVLVIQLDADGHIPEALVQRVARAAYGDDPAETHWSHLHAKQRRAFRENIRAALQSLVPSAHD